MVYTATWNMQGAGGGGITGAKWLRLAEFLTGVGADYNIIALQECGTVNNMRPNPVFLKTLHANGWDVNVYNWDIQNAAGTVLRSLFISYIQFDYGGGANPRVNLAIVSALEPQTAITTFAERRPAMGVTFAGDNITYFTVHANAAHGCDVEDLIANICTTEGPPWIAMGDYNKQPNEILFNGEVLAQFTAAYGLYEISSGHNTHPRLAPVRQLDYAVATGDVVIAGPTVTYDFGMSDHLGVLFHLA